MGRMVERLGHHAMYAGKGGVALDMVRAAHNGTGPPLDIVFLDK
jgi:hypothetical protein